MAVDYLTRRGAVCTHRNLPVGRGEIDAVVLLGGRRVAVEVKTSLAKPVAPPGLPVEAHTQAAHLTWTDPVHFFDAAKAEQVWSLARRAGCERVDLVAVVVSPDGVRIRWRPLAA